ncbi:MAG: hypothetical protein WB559_07090 [Candidatus Acidiferrales bacterium]
MGRDPPSWVLQSEIVVHHFADFLLAAEIAISYLNRCMPKQELNLFKFSVGQMAYAQRSASDVGAGEAAAPLGNRSERATD